MSAFSSKWLALREPLDALSRNSELTDIVGPRAEIVDLGAGTGANLRFLAPTLGSKQHWLLVDNDAALLNAGARPIKTWARKSGAKCRSDGTTLRIAGDGIDCAIDSLCLDISSELPQLDFPKRCLVTASALLDLVSEAWLTDLIAHCAAADAACLFALNYDGTIALEPRSAEDDLIAKLVNMHQRTDKGFGPALGPDAWIYARSLLEHAGFAVRAVQSGWQCEPSHSKLQRALIDGWVDAALELAADERELIEDWRKMRRGQIRRRKLRIVVGHRDVVATRHAVS